MDIEKDDFIDDTTPEVDSMEETTEETTETVEDTKPTEPVEQPKVKLKFNHEEKEYSLDDVVPLAQKGLNYDKLQERLQSLENDERLSKYDRLAQLSQLYGMSDTDLVEALYNQYYESQAESKGLTPEQIRKDHELSQREARIQSENQAKAQKEKEQADINRFVSLFPNVKNEDIKPETWEMVNKGVDITTAYLFQQNQEKDTELKILKQNKENQKKAPVSGVTVHGTDNKNKDAFLDGWEED